MSEHELGGFSLLASELVDTEDKVIAIEVSLDDFVTLKKNGKQIIVKMLPQRIRKCQKKRRG